MKKRLLCLILACMLLSTCALAYGSGTGEAVYVNRTSLAGGFTYENAFCYSSSGSRNESFIIESSPGSSVYPIVLACDTIYGGMNIKTMINYAESLGYNVVGAVNADFGYSQTLIPCGMVVEDGIYKSSPEGCAAVGFTDGRAYASVKPEVYITLENEDGGGAVTTTHLNKTRTDSGVWLYSEYFSTVSTRTSSSGWYVRLKVLSGELTLDGQMQLEVTELVEGEKSVGIGEGYLILTASDAAGEEAAFSKFEVGDRVTLSTECSDAQLAAQDWVTGSGNILVKDGAIFEEERWNSTITGVNPRTAIGIKPDGTVIYLVNDGRSTSSRGSTLRQLADDLLSMGCTTVMNLDGGGSSALALRMPGTEGFTVVNSPSDGSLRSCCSYILFISKNAPTGGARNLFLSQNGAYVLAGSSVELGFAATDNALRTVETPSVTASASRGSISGGVYTAPASAGTDTIRLSSGSAYGSGTLHVITKADSLSVTDAGTGAVLSSLVLEKGESFSVDVAAKYLLREVYMDDSAVTYAVSGSIGTVTKDGLFTATGSPGAEGKLTVAAAGLSYDITIKLESDFADMAGHWAESYVKALFKAGIVTGVSDTEFGPELSMKRCDFVLMLYRAAGSPAVSEGSGFADVPDSAYYASAVAWAYKNGVTQGKGEGQFAPTDTLTRQEGFTFLYRALGLLGLSVRDGDVSLLEGFADSASVADWARTPAATLISLGIVQGSDTGLMPGSSLTRAQMAKMLQSAIELA